MLLFHMQRSIFLFCSLLFLQWSTPTYSAVFFSKEEAMELAFGRGAIIESRPVFLSDEQVQEVERLAMTKLDSQLFTFFEGYRDGKLLGYAVIDSHTVRTQPETLLVVLSPEGTLIKSEILAFHEPPEYKPSSAWFSTLIKKPISELRQNQGVDGISGATLSVKASLEGIRKTLAVYRVAFSALEK